MAAASVVVQSLIKKDLIMKRFVLMLVMPWLISFYAVAQFSVSGIVREKNSGQVMSGASIGIEGQYLGAVSDVSGAFILKNMKVIYSKQLSR